jgi:hypothetical protein
VCVKKLNFIFLKQLLPFTIISWVFEIDLLGAYLRYHTCLLGRDELSPQQAIPDTSMGYL